MRLARAIPAVLPLLLATAARPVVLEVVNGQTGQAVPGVRFELEDGTQGQTDDQGRADVPEGSRVVLEKEDHAITVVEVGSEDQRALLWPLVGWMVQNPGRGWGGLAFGPLYTGMWSDDLQLDDFDVALTLNGSPVSPGTTDEGALNDQRDFEFDFDVVGGHVAIGMPRFGIGPVTFFPALNGTLGYGDLSFDNLSSADGTGSRYDAEGTLFGLGVDLVVLPFPDCPTFLGVAYDFRYFQDDHATHHFDVSPGTQVLEEQADITYRQNLLSVRLGHSFFDHHVSPYAGLLFDFSELKVRADSVQQVPTTPTPQIAMLDQSFELSPKHSLHGLAGIDLRIPCLPVFLRAETRFNDEDVGVLTKLVWLFDAESVSRRLP